MLFFILISENSVFSSQIVEEISSTIWLEKDEFFNNFQINFILANHFDKKKKEKAKREKKREKVRKRMETNIRIIQKRIEEKKIT